MKTKITSKATGRTLFFFVVSFFTIISSNAQSFQWAKSVGGSGIDKSNAVTTDALGNVYTTGFFTGTVDFDPGPSSYTLAGGGIFISKVDAAGNLIWAKNMSGSSNFYTQSIALDATGNIYTAGGFDGSADFDPGPANVVITSSGNTDAFVSKLDASGNYVWAKTFGGVSSFEYANSLALDATGDVYITGSFNGTNSDFDPGVATYTLTNQGSYDAFVVKLTAAGNFVWAKGMGGGIADYGRCIKVDASNNVYTTGYYQNTADFDPSTTSTYTITAAGMNDIYVSKLDASGNFVWAKSMGSAGNDWGYALDLDASGNVFTTGGFQSTGDFDPGVGTYSLTFGGVFISKLDNSGNFVWAAKLASNGSYGQAISVDAAGSVYTTGGHVGGDFDPGAGTVNLNSIGFSDVFISQLDANGNYLWAGTAGDFGTDNAFGINVNNNAIHVTGYYNGAGDFDPTAGTYSLTPVGSYDMFTIKLNTSPTGSIEKNNYFNNTSIFPNPFTSQITFELRENNGKEVTVVIYNSLGQIVRIQKGSSDKITLQRENLSPGVYFYKATQEGKVIASGKIIAE